MGGANYMGGKRNAAKARSRDATGRAQKGFFHRQRLEMLSKGLTSAKEVPKLNICAMNVRGAGEDPVQGIALAHARKFDEGGHPASLSLSSPQQHTFIPSPTKVGSDDSSTGEITTPSRKTPSKLLVALDTCEPILLRAAMDRILALPDLAGLSTFRKRPNIPTPQSSSPRSPKRVKPEHFDRPPVPSFAPQTPKKRRPREMKKPPAESTPQAPHKPSITFKLYSPSPPPPQCDDDWFDPITEWADSQPEPFSGYVEDRTSDPSSDWDLEFEDSDRSISLPEYIYNQESPGYVQSRTRSCLVDYTSSSPLEELQEAWENSILSGELLDAGQDPNVQPSAHLQEINSLLANGREVDATSLLGEGIDQGSAAVSIFDTESPWDAIGNILGFSRNGADETAFHQEISAVEECPLHDQMTEPREDDTLTIPTSSQQYTGPHDETHHTVGYGHPEFDTDPLHAPDIVARNASPDCGRPDADPISQHLQGKGTVGHCLEGLEAASLMENKIPIYDVQLPCGLTEDLVLRPAGAETGPFPSADTLLQDELEPRTMLEPPAWGLTTIVPKIPNTDRSLSSERHEVEGTQIEANGIGRLEDLPDVNQVNHGPALFLDFGDDSEKNDNSAVGDRGVD